MHTFFYLVFLLYSTITGLLAVDPYFYCNFDGLPQLNQLCGGATFANNPASLGPTFTATTGDSISGTIPIIYITDITSITKPTEGSTEVCKIPFKVNNNDYYFCYQDSITKYTCETTSGETRECKRDNFLRAKTTNAGAAFTSFINLNNVIQLPSPGQYRMKFYTFIHCRVGGCEAANDKIVVKIKEDGQTDFNKEIFSIGSQDGRIRDNKWNLETVIFNTETNKINLRIEFSRKTAFASQGLMAVDEISILPLEDEPNSTTVLPSTTSSLTTSAFITTSSPIPEDTTSTTLSSTSTDTTTTPSTSTESTTMFIITTESSTIPSTTTTQEVTTDASTTSTTTLTTTISTSSTSLTTTTPVETTTTTSEITTTTTSTQTQTSYISSTEIMPTETPSSSTTTTISSTATSTPTSSISTTTQPSTSYISTTEITSTESSSSSPTTKTTIVTTSTTATSSSTSPSSTTTATSTNIVTDSTTPITDSSSSSTRTTAPYEPSSSSSSHSSTITLTIPHTNTTDLPVSFNTTTVNIDNSTDETTITKSTTQTLTTVRTTPSTRRTTITASASLPESTISFSYQINITGFCDSFDQASNIRLENAFKIFFMKYFKTLTAAEVDYKCNIDSGLVPFKLYFSVNEENLSELRNSFQDFTGKLDTSIESLELEFESIAERNDLNITIYFSASIASFASSTSSITGSNICPLLTCYNKYFTKQCKGESFSCEHECSRTTDTYCRNSATCIPLYDREYQPKCLCKVNKENDWGLYDHYSGDQCEKSYKSISQNLFILLMVIAGALALFIAFLAIILFRRNKRRQKHPYDPYNDHPDNDIDIDIRPKYAQAMTSPPLPPPRIRQAKPKEYFDDDGISLDSKSIEIRL